MSALTEQEMEGLNPGESPDYATRLRDEVAMRHYFNKLQDGFRPIDNSKVAVLAFDVADAFMSERKRREESK